MTPWEVLIPISVSLAFFAAVAVVTKTIVDARRSRERLRLLADVHNRLIDRIGSAREFGELLSTEGGAKFVASLGAEPASTALPLDRVIRAQQNGAIMSALGAGALLVSWTFATSDEGQAVFGSLGVLTLSAGIGSWLSSRAALRLSQRYGLLQAGAANAPQNP